MKTYKVMSHTADVRLWVVGDTLAELFTAALEGMAHLVKEPTEIGEKNEVRSESIKIESNDTTALLIDFLSEVLTLSHSNKTVYTDVKFERINETSITGTVTGIKANGFDNDIKAVTYHEADIIKNEIGNYSTMIVFDI